MSALLPPTSDLLTVNDVARRLQVAVRTVWRWLAVGRLPQPLRFSSICIRWRRADVDQFIAALAHEAQAPQPA
jgi:predicted DNA-binding transcriptional regulator AlpA